MSNTKSTMTTPPPATKTDWPTDPLACCLRFVDECQQTAGPNPRIGSSYLLKHIVEAAAGAYIAMAALLTAARQRGLPMRQLYGSPNFYLGLSTRSVEAFKARYGIGVVV